MDHSRPISFLYTNIGRGHPFYLDGIVERLAGIEPAPEIRIGEVDKIATGWSRFAWRGVRRLYRWGAARGPVGYLYDGLRQRTDYNRPSPLLRLLGRDLKRAYGVSTAPLIVAHPSLVGMLQGRPNLVYQHGEAVTPSEAVVRGASLVCVPTEAAAKPFLAAGYEDSQLLITGLCVEPALATGAADAFQARQNRLASGEVLTGLYVSSGAEPQQHVNTLISCITSCATAGGRAVVLARNGGRLERAVRAGCRRSGIELTEYRAGERLPEPAPTCLLARHSNRREENDLSSDLFGAVDYLVAPSHERTNWALGLGLPMFALTPTVGSFAPLNLKLLQASGTGLAVGDEIRAESFGAGLAELHSSSRLREMSEAGWGQYAVDGFAVIADYLHRQYCGDR